MYTSIITIFLSAVFLTSNAQQVKVSTILVDSSFDNASLLKLEEATRLLENVFNSEAFAQSVLSEKFSVGHYNLSSEEILEIIRSGMDNYKNAEKDYSIDLRLTIYDSYKGGKEYGNTAMISRITSTHRCYILYNDVTCYASHLAHEYMHEVGFFDVKSWVGLRRTKINSVPYKIGRIVSGLINQANSCPYRSSTCKKE